MRCVPKFLRAVAAAAAILAAGAACAQGPRPAPDATAAPAWLATARPLTRGPEDYEALAAAARGKRFVLLGEDTHGTSEFYLERARITERLIRDGAVSAVAIEADWPEVERVNRYVRGLSNETAEQALGDLREFPRWMWRNTEFLGFVERLRTHNQTLPPEQRVGLYGMDVQNLGAAIASVLAYLDRTDPAAAARARSSYRCFPREGGSEEAYGLLARRPKASCEEQARTVLAEFVTKTAPADPVQAEALFMAASAAANVVGAEAYIRAQYAGTLAWNVRDRAMAAAVESMARHGGRLRDRPGQVVAWAHNTHVGDARATDARYRGEINLGQVLREQAAAATLLVGFLTHGGTVIAAEEWDQPGRRRDLRPALPGSWSAAFRELGRGDVVVPTAGAGPTTGVLERAVGVIYLPQQERQSHYFEADLTRQFDWVVYIDTSRAVTPLR